MTDATTEFFAELAGSGREPLLSKVTGNVRFDLLRGGRTDHVFVAIRKGEIAVSDAGDEADCVVRADRVLFDDIAGGRANAMASLLRGALSFEGDAELLVSFQRLFPGPSGPRDRGGDTDSGGGRS